MGKKDIHDYINIYGMLTLTFLMLVATGLIAYSAFIKIPKQIEKSESASLLDWEKFDYQAYSIFSQMEFNLDTDEIANECKNSPKNSIKVLEKSHVVCKGSNIEQKINVMVYKNNESECFYKINEYCK